MSIGKAHRTIYLGSFQGNTEEENYGYVVLKKKYPRMSREKVVVRGEALLRPPPPLSAAGFWIDM
jgi:hypothetical protein